MKKNTTTLLLLVAAGAAAFFFLRKKGGATARITEEATEIEEKPGQPTDEEAEKTDAVVTAPKGQFNEAVEKAMEVAKTIKDAAVVVKSADKTAVIKTGKKKNKKVKRPKLSQAAIDKACKGLKGRARRQCIAKLRKTATITPKVMINPFNPYAPPIFRAEADSTRIVK
jgi:hypothetical protein